MRQFFAAGFTALAIAAQAAPPVPAGTYLLEQGEGTLKVKTNQTFSIDTLGTNAHTCNFTGKISDEPIQVEDSACYLSFTLQGANILVSAQNRYVTKEELGCSSFCGYRASFDGGLFYSLPNCTPDAVSKVRQEFKAQYDRKDYVTAKRTLSKLLSRCERILHWSDLDWVRNDMALAQYKTGDKAACLQTLQPLTNIASITTSELPESYPPFEAELILPIAKATRTNLKLCGASGR